MAVDARYDRRTVLITGVAPLSLGEAIALKVLENTPETTIVAVDRKLNENLRLRLGNRGKFIVCDLNPLNYGNYGGSGAEQLTKFKKIFSGQVKQALSELGKRGVQVLYNNAGVYDFGRLEEMREESIAALLGVNVLGHICVLKAIMELNKESGIDNAAGLSLCEIGSFQGLGARAGRSVYAPSKAFGIDHCQSLATGKELRQVVYIAAPPIDTPMLHYNHWVTKSSGPENFWKRLYGSDSGVALYKAIFRKCADNRLKEAIATTACQGDSEKIARAFLQYKKIRGEYMIPPTDIRDHQTTGVAFADEVAATAWRKMHGAGSESRIVIPKVYMSAEGRREYDDFFDQAGLVLGNKGSIERCFIP